MAELDTTCFGNWPFSLSSCIALEHRVLAILTVYRWLSQCGSGIKLREIHIITSSYELLHLHLLSVMSTFEALWMSSYRKCTFSHSLYWYGQLGHVHSGAFRLALLIVTFAVVVYSTIPTFGVVVKWNFSTVCRHTLLDLIYWCLLLSSLLCGVLQCFWKVKGGTFSVEVYDHWLYDLTICISSHVRWLKPL